MVISHVLAFPIFLPHGSIGWLHFPLQSIPELADAKQIFEHQAHQANSLQLAGIDQVAQSQFIVLLNSLSLQSSFQLTLKVLVRHWSRGNIQPRTLCCCLDGSYQDKDLLRLIKPSWNSMLISSLMSRYGLLNILAGAVPLLSKDIFESLTSIH